MQLRHLRYFVKIVDAGSFSRAAALIHVAQPALSQQIAELEIDLGVTLLQRSARGVRPTAAGEALYREASDILRQMEQLPGIVRSTAGEIAGVVTLGMSSTLAARVAGPFIEACRIALPKVNQRLVTGDSLQIKARIESGEVDLGVVFEDRPTPGFARRALFRQKLYLVRRAGAAGSANTVSMSRLAKLSLILPAQPNVTRLLLDRVFREAGISPAMVAEVDVLSSMLSAVQSGVGEAIIPNGDVSEISGFGDLRSLAIEPPVYLIAAVVASADRPLPIAAEAVRSLFADFMRDRLTENPPPGAEWIAAEAAISENDSPIAR